MNFIKRYWRIIFPAFFIIVIWCFSSANGDSSSAMSGAWASRLHIEEGILRKMAHVFLFACLGYSISSPIKATHPLTYPRKSYMLIAMVITAAYGAFDEVHQLVTPGRSAQVSDILLDSTAGVCGVLIYIALFCFIRQFRAKKAIEQ